MYLINVSCSDREAPSNSAELGGVFFVCRENKNSGAIEKDEYMRYAEYNRDYLYYLGDNTLNYFTGVMPVNMEVGIEYYLESNKHPYTNAVWAPYCVGRRDAKLITAEKIEDMISQDLPVVFSYYSLQEQDKIHLYHSFENAKEKVTAKATRTNAHYMTIIGYSKYLKDDGISYSYILKVISWGDIYYIDYDEYAEKLSYFSNILAIGA